MSTKTLLILAIILLTVFVAGFALAGSDSNLCDSDWAGQCQTQRDWEAGWCYANQSSATCDSLYSDVAGQMGGGSTAQTNGGAAAESQGSQQQRTQQSQQSDSVDPPDPIKAPTEPVQPAPTPTDHPDWVEDCPPGYACAD